jgi:hypothetical protein
LGRDEQKLCELYECELANGTTYRYTDHDQDITWDAASNTYTAAPGLERGPIRYNSDGQADECEITLGIDNLAFLAQVKRNILEAAKITHKLIRWDASYAADEEITLNIWVPDVSFNRSALQLRLIGLLDSLNIKVPGQMYQEPCNFSLFDPTCGLTRADYAYIGTATSGTRTTLIDSNAGTLYKVDFDGGDSSNPIDRSETITGGDNGYTAVVVQIVYLTSSAGTIWYLELSNSNNFNDNETLSSGGDSVVVNGTAAEDTAFYEQGELEITSGDNDGESRPVFTRSGNTTTVFWPYAAEIAGAVTYKLYPGCDFRPETCEARFNNEDNWRGYPWVPPIEETIF